MVCCCGVQDLSRMGCGPSNAAVPVAGEGMATISKLVYPRPEAFEIPLAEEGDAGSLIKKHPPKRLKRLEEQPSTASSIEDLEEKLATAEIRRQQFLANRSRQTTYDKGSLDATENDASTIPEEGEDDRSTGAGDGAGMMDPEDSGVERTAPQENRHRSWHTDRGPPKETDTDDEEHDDAGAGEEDEDDPDPERMNRRRRGSDLSIGHLTSMRMKMNQYRKKSHQH
ncbi:uncharacterized protein LOC118463388 [Anopheles albimanus]|uniref:Uncharacterized protein n=1 Tax=Anopheles albimanus TaxID=7167 RepID=A0A182FTR6_ANOAL|nr:uncharacterized protein LOC118463388 [Anopheles albimanus]